jgi:hypothetical protein
MASLSCLNPSWHRHGFANYRQVSKLSPPKYPNPGSGEQYKLAPFQRAGAKLTKRKTAHTQKKLILPDSLLRQVLQQLLHPLNKRRELIWILLRKIFINRQGLFKCLPRLL